MAVLELVERAAAEAAEPVKESKAPKAKGGSPKLEKPNKRIDESAKSDKAAKPKREAAPKKVTKGEGAKKASTQKAGKAQTSTPKKSV